MRERVVMDKKAKKKIDVLRQRHAIQDGIEQCCCLERTDEYAERIAAAFVQAV